MERQTKEFYLQFETEMRERRGDCVLIEGTKVAGEPRRRSLPYILIFPHILKLALLSSFQMNHTAPARVRSFPTRTGSLICCHQPVQPSPVCGGWVSTHTEHSRDVQARRPLQLSGGRTAGQSYIMSMIAAVLGIEYPHHQDISHNSNLYQYLNYHAN